MGNAPSSSDYKTYLFRYGHDGGTWIFEVRAVSEEDAKARVRKMATASLDGELVAKIPSGLGLLPRLLVAVRNALSRKSVETNVFKA